MSQTIGIIGGGQLGRMLTFEAKKLGFTVIVLDPTPNSPAGQVADKQIVAHYKDEKAIRELGKQVNFLTFEIELANAEVLSDLSKQGVIINPAPATLAIIKDKFLQKEFLRKNGLPIAEFSQVITEEDVKKMAEKYGYPVVLKARTDAYDGRGNALIKSAKEISAGFTKLSGRELYLEAFVDFSKELSVVVARSMQGEVISYPVVETVHKNNICHLVFAPADIPQKAQKKARKVAELIMQNLEGAGVFAIEMFYTKNGEIVINEIAPRVHNSGHYTIEASHTSQFEQHIRAITGLPLGSSEMKVPAAVMINILGKAQHPAQVDGLSKSLAIPEVAVHIYGKEETKPERKMGHITATGATMDIAHKRALKARKHLTI